MLYATRKVLQNGHSIESEYDVPQERNNVEKPATIHDVTEMLKEQDKQVYSTEIVLWYNHGDACNLSWWRLKPYKRVFQSTLDLNP